MEQSSEKRVDSTSNIRRRYKHLFRLPARNRTLVYASVVVTLIALISRAGLATPIVRLATYVVSAEILLLLSIEIDRQVLKGRNRVATYRRLASLTIISNGFWLALTILGYVVLLLTKDESRLLSIVILGAFFAISFRALIFGSLFYDRPWQGIPLSFLQPGLLFIPVAFGFRILTIGFFMASLDPLAAIIGGFIALAGIEIYMTQINKLKISLFRPLELLQAFMNAWAAEDVTNLERFLEATSKEVTLQSEILSISSKTKRATIIVPGVHPGPFYPIGSSNISADIFSRLKSKQDFPIIVHSMSDHERNLPSRNQVERYIKSLKDSNLLKDSGSTMSEPVVKTRGKATVAGIFFGSTLLTTITQAPHGMEDFPSTVHKKIEAYASDLKNSLVVDSHNSEGEKPNEAECEDAILAAQGVIDELRMAKQSPFEVGIAHSSEIDARLLQDIGPAGVSLILFKVNNNTFSLVVSDSNNSVLGFREKVFSRFEATTNSKILELCTSDTHVTAAKTSDAKGYLALGDVTSSESFADLLGSLYKNALMDLANGSFSSHKVQSQVKTIGSEVLDDFSGLLDSASTEAKNGAQALGAIVFIITIIVALI